MPERNPFELVQAGLDDEVVARLDADPGVMTWNSPDGWTVLHAAVFFHRNDLARELLRRGANVHIRSTNDMANQPLHAARASLCATRARASR